jgi:hypothetical protein
LAGVGAIPAVEMIRASTAAQFIVSTSAFDVVVAFGAVEQIADGVTNQRVQGEEIRTQPKGDNVAALAAPDVLLSPGALERRVTNEVTGALHARLRPGPARGRGR